MKRPTVFIGSSSEGLEVARAAGFQLADTAEVTVWNEGVFKPGLSGLESLMNALDRFDFAVFVFTPDDEVTTRGETRLTPRDNVLFELGLFIGRLGRTRTFVIAGEERLGIASDLHGITLLSYNSKRRDRNWKAAVGAACITIREAIRDLGLAETRGLQKVQEASEQLQSDVEQAVQLLARARAFETELFLKYQGGLIVSQEEANRLKRDITTVRL